MEENNFIREKHLINYAKSESIGDLKSFLEQMEKSVCKIYCPNGGDGTGFFCMIQNGWESLRFLITNYHVLSEENIEKGKKIKFSLNNEKIQLDIFIDDSRKIIPFEDYDITFIEIKENDRLEKISFLEIDNQSIKNKAIFANMPVYLLHYPEGIEVMKASGVIKNISENNYTIQHLCDSNFGSSGGPLINSKNYKVIGIHKGGAKNDKNWNLGTLLDEPIKKLKEKIEIINKKNNEINNNEINHNEINNNEINHNEINNNEINNNKEKDKNTINNNILYYNENIKDLEKIYKDSDYFETNTLGAFILCTNMESLKLISKEIIRENKKDNNILFNLILGEFNLDRFKTFLNENKEFEKCIQNTLIYNNNIKANFNIENLKILNVFNNKKDINDLISILSSKDINPFPLAKLIKYQDYLEKYKIFHKKISQFYGDLTKESYEKYFNKIKLLIEKEEKEKRNIKNKKILIDGFSSFEIKEDPALDSVDKSIIREWTKNTIYADLNKWLYSLNIDDFDAPAYFASRFMYSLNSFAKKKGLYFKNDKKVYRGVKKTYSSLIPYERLKGKIITLSSFISSCLEENVALVFAGMDNSKNEYEMNIKFSTEFIIKNSSKNDNVSCGIDIQTESTLLETEILFQPFSFYYVRDIKIDTQNYSAKIYLKKKKKNEILEEKIKKGKEIEYNEKKGIIQVKK